MSMKKIVFLLLLALFVIFAGGCKNDDEKNSWDTGSLDVVVDETTPSKGEHGQNPKTEVEIIRNIQDCYTTYASDTNIMVFTAYEREGYGFLGWYADETFETLLSTALEYKVQYSALNQYVTDGKLTLYAKFAQKSAIVYDLCGGEFISDNIPTGYIEGYDFALPQLVAKEGYEFAGWRLASTGQTVLYIPKTHTGEVKVSAVWAHPDISEDIAGTVWMYEDDDSGDLIAVFGADGSFDLFGTVKLKNGEKIHMNLGALLETENAVNRTFMGKENIHSSELTSISYQSEKAIYSYTEQDGYYEVKRNRSSKKETVECLYRWQLFCQTTMRFQITEQGLTAAFHMPATIIANGETINFEDWINFVDTTPYDDLLAMFGGREDEIVYTDYVPADYEMQFKKVSNAASTFYFESFSSKDAVKQNLGYEENSHITPMFVKNTILILSRFDPDSNQFFIACWAFQRDEYIYQGLPASHYVDFIIPYFYPIHSDVFSAIEDFYFNYLNLEGSILGSTLG